MDDTALALIEAFAVHGGRLDHARAAFPQVAEWSDLSTGIAPWCYPPDAIADATRRLPDPADLRALENAAAASFGVAAHRVVAVPGSDLALRLLGAIIPGTAAVMRPGYSGHCAMWADGAATMYPQGNVAAAARAHDALVLARPNNPDGWIAERSALADTAAELASGNGFLIVDEAFADATPDDSVAACDWPGLIVLRSFGKFFGLAGLRLGFVIAPETIRLRLRALIGDWPVAGPAIAIGGAAYCDTAWQAAQRARLSSASLALKDMLAAHRLTIVGGTRFFILISSPHRDALFVHLARAGLLTRPFADAPDRLRIGLPQRDADWKRLNDALVAWRSQ